MLQNTRRKEKPKLGGDGWWFKKLVTNQLVLTNTGELIMSNTNEFRRAISRRDLFKGCFYIKGSQIVGHKKFRFGEIGSNSSLYSQLISFEIFTRLEIVILWPHSYKWAIALYHYAQLSVHFLKNILHMHVLLPCIYGHHVHSWYPGRPEEDVGSSPHVTGLTPVCEAPFGCLD